MDWFGNGLDDADSKNNFISLIIGQTNTSGPAVEM